MHTTPATLPRWTSTIALVFALFALLAIAPAASAQDRSPDNRRRHFNLNNRGLALKGYDPVSYHQGRPQRGDRDHEVTYRGVTYRFANEENKATFEEDPAHYEPAFGGWCAWAMLDGDKTDIDPNNYLLINDRLYVFYKGVWGDTRADWQEKAREEDGNHPLIREATAQWNWILRPGNR